MKAFTEFLHGVETTPLAIFVSQSTYGFAAIDMFHIASVSVVFGMIAILDLRLIGMVFTDFSVTDLSLILGGIVMAAFMNRIAAARRLGAIIVIGMAVFCLPTALLTVVHAPWIAFLLEVVRGAGTIVVDVLAIDCGNSKTDCFVVIPVPTALYLRAFPRPNASFESWSGSLPGSCIGSHSVTCPISLRASGQIQANFLPYTETGH